MRRGRREAELTTSATPPCTVSLRELRSQLESLRRRLGQKEAEVGRLEDELAHKDSVIKVSLDMYTHMLCINRHSPPVPCLL